jgi:hypothetical protein
MDLELFLQQAFRHVAGYMTNINSVKTIIEEIVEEATSVEETITLLTARLKTVDVTVQTDIQILINEVKHLQSKGEL